MKRHIQNCLSKEKRIFESNIKECTKLNEIKCENIGERKYSKIQPVIIIGESSISDPLAITSEDEVKCSEFEEIPENSNSKVRYKDVKSWAIRNKISQAALDDFLHMINEEKITDVSPSCSNREKIKISRIPEIIQVPRIPNGHLLYADVVSTLKEIVVEQKELKSQLEKLEENQLTIIENQNILSIGQGTIVSNQEQIVNAIEKIEENKATKSEVMAQTKILMECKVSMKRIEHSICPKNGKSYDKNIGDVANILPLRTVEAVQEVEDKLSAADYAHSMTCHLIKVKGVSEDVSSVVRAIFTDDLLDKYNWEGRWEKRSLAKLKIFDKILREVFEQQNAFEFEKNIKKAVQKSHHRVNQKNYLKKEQI